MGPKPNLVCFKSLLVCLLINSWSSSQHLHAGKKLRVITSLPSHLLLHFTLMKWFRFGWQEWWGEILALLLCFFCMCFAILFFSFDIFSTHLTLICLKCLLHMKKHLYEVIPLTFVKKKFKIKWYMKNISKKAHTLCWFPVKDIKISDNLYKIRKFLRLSCASVITNKDLLHLIIWM